MRVAVYGGSFNPPHLAHGMVAAWLLRTEQADEVWLVPVYQHAFEGLHGKHLAPYSDRVEWCRIMAEETDPRVRVSEVEADLSVPSFTIDTLHHLAQTHPEHTFRLVVGADVLGQVDSWRDWPGIQERYSPIVVGREGHAVPDGVPVFPGISSTEIRRRLAAGESVDGMITAGVAAALAGSAAWAD